MGEAVRVEVDGPRLEITLDRPPVNAIDAATSRDLGAAFQRLRDDPELRVAILTGSGDRYLSAGWDLKAAAAGEAPDADYGPGGFGGFAELPGLDKPVIVAANGTAVGGGFELMLAADLVVAADHAEFWLPEASIGLVPDLASLRLPRMLPAPIANELLLAGRRLGADEAARWGLVNRVVPGGDVLRAARALADRVAAAAPLAVGAILAVIRTTAHLSLEEASRMLRSGGIAEYQRAIQSEDAREGAAAFADKRIPRWRGR